MTTPGLDDLRRSAENLVRRDALAQFEAWLSGSYTPPPEPELTDNVDPFTPAAVQLVAQELQRSGGNGTTRVLQLLHRGLYVGALDRELRPALAALSGSATAHLSYLSGEPALPDAGQTAWQGATEAAERVEVHRRLLLAWAGSAPLYLQAVRHLHEAGAELGQGGPDELVRIIARVEPADLRLAARRLLESTDSLYEQALEEATAAHRLQPLPAHLPRLFGLPELDHRFTAERMLPVAGSLLEGLGLPISRQPGLLVLGDPQDRPRPSRAFPVNLPREVRLVVHRSSGLQAAQLHLLALGQALHWLNTEAGPFPCRWPFGHRAISDGHGLLLASLLTHPGVLVDRGLPLEVAETLARVSCRATLLQLRTLAALLATHPGGPELADEPHAAYAAAIARARLLPLSDAEALAWPQRIEATYAAETLQSWILAATMRSELRRQLGERWWGKPEAAELWLTWLRPGQRSSVTELLATLTEGVEVAAPLDPAPLVAWMYEGR